MGIERHAVGLAYHLAKQGHTVTIFTTFWNGGKAVDRFEGMVIYRAPDLSNFVGRIAGLFDLHYITWGQGLLNYWSALKECDIVHALAPLSSTKKLTMRGIPVVTHFHHYEEIRRTAEVVVKPFHHQLERKAYRLSTLVMTPSESSCQDLHSKFGIPFPKIAIVPHAIDTSKFPYRPRSRFAESIRILYVGAHERRKGLNYLLEAMASLRNSGINAKLVTVGHGPMMGSLRDISQRLGISDLVDFRGYVADPDSTLLPQIYAESDIFVLPSLQEGFGFVLLEAMATGLPIVATNVSAIPEVLGDAGILVPPRDAKALAEALKLLLEDRSKRLELGKRGQARLEALFTWDRVIPQVMRVYEEAIEIARRVS